MNNDEDDDSELWDEDSEDSQPVSKEYVEEQIQKNAPQNGGKSKAKTALSRIRGICAKNRNPWSV